MSHPLEKQLEYAKDQLEVGNYGRVERAADELMNTKDSPFVKEGLLYKGLAVLSQTRQAEAMEYFNRSIAEFPDFNLPHFYKCEVLMRQGKLQEARAAALVLCATDETNPEYQNILVTVDEFLEDHQAVVNTCDKVLAIHPQNFNFLYAKATAKRALEEYEVAIETYLLADEVEGIDEVEKAYIYNDIGVTYAQLKQFEEAKKYIEMSLAFDQPHHEAQQNLDAILEQMNA